jgi:hypothetical protein
VIMLDFSGSANRERANFYSEYKHPYGTHAAYAGVSTAVQRLLNRVPINNIINPTF